MKHILTVMKKELTRFFKDRRLVASLFLPGILIYVIYSLMGSTLMPALMKTEDKSVVCAVNIPVAYETVLTTACSDQIELKKITEEEATAYGDDLQSGETPCNLLIVFPVGFAPDGVAPQTVQITYDSSDMASANAYSLVIGTFSALYSTPLAVLQPTDTATEESATEMLFSMIGPMLLLMFLFAGCVSIVPESIAGEKERGTFATMLVTPVKRKNIALGKIFALSTLSLASGTVSAIGLILSIPKLMNGSGLEITASAYGVKEYALLCAIVLSTVLIIVTITAIVSTLAKSVKEATTWISPLMILSIIVGVSGIFFNGEMPLYACFIPLFNTVQCMTCIFSMNTNVGYVLLSGGMNLVYAAGLVFLLSKMFDSEKIIFTK